MRLADLSHQRRSAFLNHRPLHVGQAIDGEDARIQLGEQGTGPDKKIDPPQQH